MSARFSRIESLYHAARLRPPEERGAFLAEACGGDEHLRREVESLLAEHAATGEFQKVVISAGAECGPAMNATMWERAKQLLAEAMKRPEGERERYVVEHCPDPELRRHILAMLATPAPLSVIVAAGASKLSADLGPDLLPPRDDPTYAHGSVSRPPLDNARFAPGHLFASRFRIVSLLGLGGMGEVYRAEDLKLGQSVAVKLLTSGLANPEALKRFKAEVRLARGIAHPNVCRVYDIGYGDGWDYLAMEYVDGEDLASLLRRVGRLPLEKVVAVARELCAGLAAAHDEGVLHRDLKPANIMIDGRGHAHITDFGLAVTIEHRPQREIAGTPAYMAPEQITGRRITERTDIFALGLIVYELLTGNRGLPVDTLQERRTRASELEEALVEMATRDVTPPLKHLVVQCLQPDPGARPMSARSVAASLPGGADPLAAAVASGEILSADIVAAAGGTQGLSAIAAWSCLSLTLAGLLLAAGHVQAMMAYRQVTLGKPPDVLVDRAQQIVKRFGFTDPPTGSAHWFASTHRYAELANDRSGLYESPRRPSRAQNGVFFVYRQSPRYLVPQNVLGVVLYREPPADVPGMADVVLDPIGRLVRFTGVPTSTPAQSSPSPDWSIPFGEAGLDIERFKRVPATWGPPVAQNSLLAWDGVHPDRPDRHLHVTAAAWDNQPVFFDIDTGEGDRQVATPATVDWGGPVAEWTLMVLTWVSLAGAAILARRNIRRQRWDRSGALRLGVFFLILTTLLSILRADHVPVVGDEYLMVAKFLSWDLYISAFLVLVYIAFEPSVRQRWPRVLVSWTRVLAGRFHDPRVGRDILVGALAGVAVVIIRESEFAVTRWLDGSPPVPFSTTLDGLGSWNQFTSVGLFVLVESLGVALGLLLIAQVLRILVRNHWLVMLGSFLVMLPMAIGATNHLKLEVLGGFLIAGIVVVVLFRFGLVSLICLFVVANTIFRMPITLNPSDWFIGRSVVVLLSLSGVAVYGFYTSLGGRRTGWQVLLDN